MRQKTFPKKVSRGTARRPAASSFWEDNGPGLQCYEKTAPALVRWAEEALPEGFTAFSLPPSHRGKLRTTNLVERLNEEIRRRTRVARLLPNEAACLRLVSAVLMELGRLANCRAALVVLTDENAIAG